MHYKGFSLDVKVGNEAGKDVLVLVGTVNADLSMIVTERGKAWDQPSDGVSVLVTG